MTTCLFIPDDIQPYLSNGECALLIGSYNVTDRNIQNDNRTSTLTMTIDGYPTSYNLRVVQGYTVSPTGSTTNWLDEVYSIASYNNVFSQNLGNITFAGLYPTSGTGGISSSSIQKFPVNGGNGIFQYIQNVIIDFRQSSTRTVYFTGKPPVEIVNGKDFQIFKTV